MPENPSKKKNRLTFLIVLILKAIRRKGSHIEGKYSFSGLHLDSAKKKPRPRLSDLFTRR